MLAPAYGRYAPDDGVGGAVADMNVRPTDPCVVKFWMTTPGGISYYDLNPDTRNGPFSVDLCHNRGGRWNRFPNGGLEVETIDDENGIISVYPITEGYHGREATWKDLFSKYFRLDQRRKAMFLASLGVQAHRKDLDESYDLTSGARIRLGGGFSPALVRV